MNSFDIFSRVIIKLVTTKTSVTTGIILDILITLKMKKTKL